MNMIVKVIAEVGVNHNGSYVLAKKYIRECKKIGVDFVKFQVAVPSEVVTKYAKKADYQKKFKDDNNQLKMLKKLHLSLNNYKKLIDYAISINIKILFSFFDRKSLNFLITNKQKYLKIPSGEINNFILLKQLRNYSGFLFISTGMSNLNEISSLLKFLKKNRIKKKQIILMHCNSEYPSPLKDINLNVLESFKKKFRVKVGYSDHSIGEIVPICSVVKGAEYIEKHITFNRFEIGPDHKASMEFKDFKSMILKIRQTILCLGSSIKLVTKSEKKNRKLVRKSIVALKHIKKGEIFSYSNLSAKRPGDGIPPNKISMLLGKKSRKSYNTDEQIKK